MFSNILKELRTSKISVSLNIEMKKKFLKQTLPYLKSQAIALDYTAKLSKINCDHMNYNTLTFCCQNLVVVECSNHFVFIIRYNE